MLVQTGQCVSVTGSFMFNRSFWFFPEDVIWIFETILAAEVAYYHKINILSNPIYIEYQERQMPRHGRVITWLAISIGVRVMIDTIFEYPLLKPQK